MNDRTTMACRVCGNPRPVLIDRIETPNCDEPVPVFRCKDCGHFSLFPGQYQEQKAFQWDGIDFYLSNRDQREAAASQVLERMRTVYHKRNRRAPASFLDAGCAIGLTLPLAERLGLKATGIEPEQKLAGYGREQLGVDIRHGQIRDLDPTQARFDLVYCEQVLEHIAEPAGFLQHMRQLLTPGGLLYIGVPPVFPLNLLTTFLIRKARLPIPRTVLSDIFLDPDEHISVFTRRSIQQLASDCEMRSEVLPLTIGTLSPKRIVRKLVALGANPGTFLFSAPANR